MRWNRMSHTFWGYEWENMNYRIWENGEKSKYRIRSLFDFASLFCELLYSVDEISVRNCNCLTSKTRSFAILGNESNTECKMSKQKKNLLFLFSYEKNVGVKIWQEEEEEEVIVLVCSRAWLRVFFSTTPQPAKGCVGGKQGKFMKNFMICTLTVLLWFILWLTGGVDGVIVGLVRSFSMSYPRAIDYVALGFTLSMLLYVVPVIFLVAIVVEKKD